jgi:hypothetical protein
MMEQQHLSDILGKPEVKKPFTIGSFLRFVLVAIKVAMVKKP